MGRILKFIDNELIFIFAIMVFIALVAALGAAALILLCVLGHFIGIDEDIFIYLATIFILSGIWDALLWVARKINDRNERKMDRERGQVERRP